MALVYLVSVAVREGLATAFALEGPVRRVQLLHVYAQVCLSAARCGAQLALENWLVTGWNSSSGSGAVTYTKCLMNWIEDHNTELKWINKLSKKKKWLSGWIKNRENTADSTLKIFMLVDQGPWRKGCNKHAGCRGFFMSLIVFLCDIDSFRVFGFTSILTMCI